MKTPRKRPFRVQWGLRTMFLLTAVVAVWIPFFRLYRENARLRGENRAMQQLGDGYYREFAKELTVRDKQQIAVLRLPTIRYDETRWAIYLPEGRYTMRLATRKIAPQGLAPVFKEALIDSGEHQISLRSPNAIDLWGITVTVDDNPLIEARESSDWDAWSCGWGGFYDCTQLPPHQPVLLYHGRKPESVTTNNPAPANGLLLWIERIDPSDATGTEP